MAPITEGMTEDDAMELHDFVSSCTGANISSVLMLGQARRILATHAALAEKTAEVERLDKALQQMGDRLDREIPALRAQLAEAQADSAKLREAVKLVAQHITYRNTTEGGEVRDTWTICARISGDIREHPADALLRWHASRQPDPAPGGTENA